VDRIVAAMDDRSMMLRRFFARYVTSLSRVRDPRIEQAFAGVRREVFAGPGPWSINLPGTGYIETPNDDLAFVYQDTLVALDAARGINIGQPSAHARWLGALDLREGDSVVQVGVGTGYYTAILAALVGPEGSVHAFEIDPGLAARARENLKDLPQVDVRAESGIAGGLPDADAVYVCAAITQPSWGWLQALKQNGKLVFPLHAVGGGGGMLMIRRAAQGAIWPARFISYAAFISCAGPQDDEVGGRLNEAYARGGGLSVRSFRTDDPDDTCWVAGKGWWLSTVDPQSG
jgi:protein-L-isoaspartate(D-aspartate) O-methyltransferase